MVDSPAQTLLAFGLDDFNYEPMMAETPSSEEINQELTTLYEHETRPASEAYVSPMLLQRNGAYESVTSDPSSGTPTSHRTESKKRKSTANSQANRIYSPELDEYVERETKRCVPLGLTFVGPDFSTILSTPGGTDHITTLEVLYFGIGSPEMVATLQQLLKTRRERSKDQQPRERHDLSPFARLRIIQIIDRKMAYMSLRRRCHIYQLFTGSITDGSNLGDAFITSTPHSMAIPRTRQLGNPLNLELARASSMALHQLYPGLSANSPDYKSKKKYVDDLRKLWQRLYQLVDIFGYGILGLVPLPYNVPTVMALNVTDEAFVPISVYLPRS